ncbi:MAG TPA: hypothetical protein VJ799_11265 [Nitrososphaeraceae archaeon]|nr:hypothetical protein [Nitrososphaeraceae archaeon]
MKYLPSCKLGLPQLTAIISFWTCVQMLGLFQIKKVHGKKEEQLDALQKIDERERIEAIDEREREEE